MVGGSIRIPGKDAGEDDIKKFHDSIIEKVPNMMMKPNFENKDQSEEFYKMAGRPSESSKYEADAPEGYTPNEDRLKFLKGLAFDEGISGKQFKGLMEKIHAEDFKVQQLQEAELTKQTDALKIKWGSAYDEKLQTSIDLSNKFFGDIFTADTIPAGYAMGLDKLSAQFSKEDLNEIKPDVKKAITPLEAQSQINEIYGNNKHPYFNKLDPLNDSATKRMVELQGLANPEE